MEISREKVNYLKDRAEECRAIADIAVCPSVKLAMLGCADSYDCMANSVEQMVLQQDARK